MDIRMAMDIINPTTTRPRRHIIRAPVGIRITGGTTPVETRKPLTHPAEVSNRSRQGPFTHKPLLGRLPPSGQGPNGQNRRILPIAGRPGERLVTEQIPTLGMSCGNGSKCEGFRSPADDSSVCPAGAGDRKPAGKEPAVACGGRSMAI